MAERRQQLPTPPRHTPWSRADAGLTSPSEEELSSELPEASVALNSFGIKIREVYVTVLFLLFPRSLPSVRTN